MGHVHILDIRSFSSQLRLNIDPQESSHYNYPMFIPDFSQALLQCNTFCGGGTLITFSDLKVLSIHILTEDIWHITTWIYPFLSLSMPLLSAFFSFPAELNVLILPISPPWNGFQMYVSVLACGFAEWPFSEVGMGSIVSSPSPVQQLSTEACDGCLQDCPPLLFEWFSIFHSAWGTPCVGGIDRPWIGLQRAWLLMSVCSGSRGTNGAPRAKLGPACSTGEGSGGGCCSLELHY